MPGEGFGGGRVVTRHKASVPLEARVGEGRVPAAAEMCGQGQQQQLRRRALHLHACMLMGMPRMLCLRAQWLDETHQSRLACAASQHARC